MKIDIRLRALGLTIRIEDSKRTAEIFGPQKNHDRVGRMNSQGMATREFPTNLRDSSVEPIHPERNTKTKNTAFFVNYKI